MQQQAGRFAHHDRMGAIGEQSGAAAEDIGLGVGEIRHIMLMPPMTLGETLMWRFAAAEIGR